MRPTTYTGFNMLQAFSQRLNSQAPSAPRDSLVNQNMPMSNQASVSIQEASPPQETAIHHPIAMRDPACPGDALRSASASQASKNTSSLNSVNGVALTSKNLFPLHDQDTQPQPRTLLTLGAAALGTAGLVAGAMVGAGNRASRTTGVVALSLAAAAITSIALRANAASEQQPRRDQHSPNPNPKVTSAATPAPTDTPDFRLPLSIDSRDLSACASILSLDPDLPQRPEQSQPEHSQSSAGSHSVSSDSCDTSEAHSPEHNVASNINTPSNLSGPLIISGQNSGKLTPVKQTRVGSTTQNREIPEVILVHQPRPTASANQLTLYGENSPGRKVMDDDWISLSPSITADSNSFDNAQRHSAEAADTDWEML
jgi:hypothetical protein